MADVLIYESGNGGELVLRGNDIATVSGYENAGYLAQWGGGSWWGNYLTDKPYVAQTETVIHNTPLNSAGRIAILNAMNSDLAFLKEIPGTTVNVQASIAGPNRLDAQIQINGKQFYLQYNPDTLFLNYQVG